MADTDSCRPGEGERQLEPAVSRAVAGRTGFSGPSPEEKLAALLSYLLGWITGTIFYFTGKSKYVKFHALQSTITFGVITIFQVVIRLIRCMLASLLQPGSTYLLLNMHGMISAFVWVGALVLWAFLMSKAYQGENYILPVAGEIATRCGAIWKRGA